MVIAIASVFIECLLSATLGAARWTARWSQRWNANQAIPHAYLALAGRHVIIVGMTGMSIRRPVERVGLWRLAAALATRWYRDGALRDRHFAMLRAERYAPPTSAPEPPTLKLPSAA